MRAELLKLMLCLACGAVPNFLSFQVAEVVPLTELEWAGYLATLTEHPLVSRGGRLM